MFNQNNKAMNEVIKTNDFNKVYETYKRQIDNQIKLKVKDEADGEDISANVFVKLYKHLAIFNPDKAKLTTWLYTIVENEITDYFRSKKYKTHIAQTVKVSGLRDENNEEFFEFQGYKSDIASNKIETEELSHKIYLAFEKLKPAQKEIAGLFFIKNKKYDEIAERLNIPLNTVKVTIMRAREVLQSYLRVEYSNL